MLTDLSSGLPIHSSYIITCSTVHISIYNQIATSHKYANKHVAGPHPGHRAQAVRLSDKSVLHS